MELTDLAHRVSVLERQLAAARWRGRVIGASALLVGLVVACKSSNKSEEPESLTIGRVRIDPTGITIGGEHGSITISARRVTIDGRELGKVDLTSAGVSVEAKHQGSSRVGTLGASSLQLRGGAAEVQLSALGSAAFNMRSGDFQLNAYANEQAAALSIDRYKTTKLGQSASLHVSDKYASVTAKVETMTGTLFAMGGDKPQASVSAGELAKGLAGLVATPGSAKLDIRKE
jgi:hypothetical protein